MIEYTQKEWLAEGEKRFGPKRSDWKFKCAQCGTVQSAHDFMEHAKDKEAMKGLIKQGVVGFSCIGRYVEGKIGCDWTLGGLFQIHKALVKLDDGNQTPVFEFADSI